MAPVQIAVVSVVLNDDDQSFLPAEYFFFFSNQMSRSPGRAPNGNSHAAQQMFRMEAQLTLNQLLFEADLKQQRALDRLPRIQQGGGGQIGGGGFVHAMHQQSSHANEAQRLANELLHRMFRTSPSRSGGDVASSSPRLPPLIRDGRPTLASAMKSVDRVQGSGKGQRRDGERRSPPGHFAKLDRLASVTGVTSPSGRGGGKSPSSGHHESPSGRQSLPGLDNGGAQSSSPLRKSSLGSIRSTGQPPTVSGQSPPRSMSSLAKGSNGAIVSRNPSGGKKLGSLRAVPTARKNVKGEPKQPVRGIRGAEHPSASHSQQWGAANTKDDGYFEEVEEIEAPPDPFDELMDSESVERSITVTMWELERSKLEQRIAKIIVFYYSWLMDELLEEEVGMRYNLLEEEHRLYLSQHARFENQTDYLIRKWIGEYYERESKERDAIRAEERLARVEIPIRMQHHKFLIYEDEYAARREILTDEHQRYSNIFFKFHMKETLFNERSLRSWIETQQEEDFASRIVQPLHAALYVEEVGQAIKLREAKQRRILLEEYEAEIPYVNRVREQLRLLNDNQSFWSEKRDIEYHQHIRRLFLASHEQQERVELVAIFSDFMLARGAVISGSLLEPVLQNESARRAFLIAAQKQEFSQIREAHETYLNDEEEESRARARRAAINAVNANREAIAEAKLQKFRNVVAHEETRRGFLLAGEVLARKHVEDTIRSILFGSDDSDTDDEQAAGVEHTLLELLVDDEEKKRRWVHRAEVEERRQATSSWTYFLQDSSDSSGTASELENEDGELNNTTIVASSTLVDAKSDAILMEIKLALHRVDQEESLRRRFLEREEGNAVQGIVAGANISEIHRSNLADLQRIVMNEELRRTLLQQQHGTELQRIVNAWRHNDDDDDEDEPNYAYREALKREAKVIELLKDKERQLCAPTVVHPATDFATIEAEQIELAALRDREALLQAGRASYSSQATVASMSPVDPMATAHTAIESALATANTYESFTAKMNSLQDRENALQLARQEYVAKDTSNMNDDIDIVDEGGNNNDDDISVEDDEDHEGEPAAQSLNMARLASVLEAEAKKDAGAAGPPPLPPYRPSSSETSTDSPADSAASPGEDGASRAKCPTPPSQSALQRTLQLMTSIEASRRRALEAEWSDSLFHSIELEMQLRNSLMKA